MPHEDMQNNTLETLLGKLDFSMLDELNIRPSHIRFIAVYIAYLIRKSETKDEITLIKSLEALEFDTITQRAIEAVLAGCGFDSLVKIACENELDDLENYLNTSWPAIGARALDAPITLGLELLTCKILNIQPDEKFIDFSCGDGRMILEAHRAQPDAGVFAYEPRLSQYAVACIHFKLANTKVEMLVRPDNTSSPLRTEEIFTVSEIEPDKKISINKACMFGGSYHDSNWKFTSVSNWQYGAKHLISNYLFSGKAVFLAHRWDLMPDPTRKVDFSAVVDEGWVESVTLLRDDDNARDSIALIVLSNDNDSIRFVDATDLCSSDPAVTKVEQLIPDDEVENIFERMHADGEHSCSCSKDEVQSTNYILDPKTRLVMKDEPAHTLLGNVASRISVGTPNLLPDTSLVSWLSATPTNLRVISSDNIVDGRIQGQTRYCVPLEQIERIEFQEDVRNNKTEIDLENCLHVSNLDPFRGSRVKAPCILLPGRDADWVGALVLDSTPDDEILLIDQSLSMIQVDPNRIDLNKFEDYLNSDNGKMLLANAKETSTPGCAYPGNVPIPEAFILGSREKAPNKLQASSRDRNSHRRGAPNPGSVLGLSIFRLDRNLITLDGTPPFNVYVPADQVQYLLSFFAFLCLLYDVQDEDALCDVVVNLKYKSEPKRILRYVLNALNFEEIKQVAENSSVAALRERLSADDLAGKGLLLDLIHRSFVAR